MQARKAHKDVVKLLLDKGADPNAQTSTGVTPLYDVRAGAEINTPSWSLILNHAQAAQNADYETVKIMVDGGARVKTRPDDGFTPLHAAAWMGKYDTAKLLLEEGSDVHLAHKNHQGTALHMAVYYGHYDCVRLLLRWGAKVNVRMSGGATPLFLAVEKGPAAVARLLLRWGADPEIPREDGETVFTAQFESLVDARALLAENYLSAGAPFDYDAEDAERLEREQAPFRPFPPLWVRFLRVVAAALVVVLVSAEWTQRKLRDYFLRPLARITNRVSPRGYATYDWEE